jgi:hypothetical protein
MNDANKSAGSKTKSNSESKILLLDSGRYPLWFRLPAVAIGLTLYWFSIAITTNHYFGIQLGLGNSTINSSPLVFIIIMFGIGLPFLFVWFAQKRISFDPVNKGLFVERRGFIRWHGTLMPLTDCHELHIYQIRVFACVYWDLSMIQSDGSLNFLTYFTYFKKDKNWLQSFRNTLEENTGLPVVVDERGSSSRISRW